MVLHVQFFLLLASACCISFVPAFSPVPPFLSTPTSKSNMLYVSLEQLDDSNMKDLLFHPSKGKAVLVDAYAPWCGPCKLIEPYLQGCAKRYSDQLSVIKYDVEGNNNKNLKVEMLLQGVMVRGLPTLILYNNGRPLATHSGAITEEGLEEWLVHNLFSKMDELETEARHFMSSVKMEPMEEQKEENPTCIKRGFVSFASKFDDYAI